mgnify:CR=1 FL=1
MGPVQESCRMKSAKRMASESEVPEKKRKNRPEKRWNEMNIQEKCTAKLYRWLSSKKQTLERKGEEEGSKESGNTTEDNCS